MSYIRYPTLKFMALGARGRDKNITEYNTGIEYALFKVAESICDIFSTLILIYVDLGQGEEHKLKISEKYIIHT